MCGDKAYEQAYKSSEKGSIETVQKADGHTAETASRSFEVMESHHFTPRKVPHYKFTDGK